MSTTTLLQLPTSPQSALTLSQQAPTFIASQTPSFSLPYPLSLLTTNESQAKWQIHENLFLACLRTGDTNSAYALLENLTDRFGKVNERVMALQGLYQEATAKSEGELEEVMRQYEDLLKEDPTLFSIRKRRAALLKSMGRLPEAINALTSLLDASPTDAEAWAELGDLYLLQGAIEQAAFCFEEVLLITPNAWNMHARLGDVLCLSASRVEEGGNGEKVKRLAESMRRFCRSVELCEDYLRGYYGLKVTSFRLRALLPTASSKANKPSSDSSAGELPPPSLDTVEKLNRMATAKLAEIVRRSKSGEKGWDGYSQAELIAARELLDRDTGKIER